MENEGNVIVHKNELRVGTLSVARSVERKHTAIIRTIKNNIEDFEDYGKIEKIKTIQLVEMSNKNDLMVLKTIYSKSKRGRPTEEYLLNEQQIFLLITYLRNMDNNPKVRLFKKALINEFFRMKALLATNKMRIDSKEWIKARADGKVIRVESTDIIKLFIEYSVAQGYPQDKAKCYYAYLTHMLNSALFVTEGKFKNLRSVMTARQLMVVSSADTIVRKALSDGMKKNTHHKQIYDLAVERMLMFAEIHGQSEIMQKHIGYAKEAIKQLTLQ